MDTHSLDQSIRTLAARKDEWAGLSIAARRSYLSRIAAAQAIVASPMVAAAVQAKGVPPGPLEAEEWSGGPYPIIRYARLLGRTLDQIQATGRPVIDRNAIRTRPDGQVAVQVFPASAADRILWRGFRAEAWMRPGITPANLTENLAGFYRRQKPAGKVGLVLGAGNVASIGPLDVLSKMYGDGQVCLLKLSPVNQYLAPFIQSTFGDLIRDGFLRLASGGADVGEYLCNHPQIEEIHITGSNLTHDAIVFGAGGAGQERKRARKPRMDKPISSELGNVSPVIVLPGPWSPDDIRFHAANIATQMVNNAGFNCCAARVLITPREWPLAGRLLDELRSVLASTPQRRAYYPGAEDRYNQFIAGNSTAQAVGTRRPGVLPWTLIPDLDPEDATNICFTRESFCGVLAQTALAGREPADFLRRAVSFCNETLWGTLTACVIAHPESERLLGAGFGEAISSLRYGTIAVNQSPCLGFALGTTTWGAFPGHTADDIQSGTGVVHNAMLFDRPERTVIYGPFRTRPEPAWFVTNRRAHRIMPALVRLESRPGIGNLARVLARALAGA